MKKHLAHGALSRLLQGPVQLKPMPGPVASVKGKQEASRGRQAAAGNAWALWSLPLSGNESEMWWVHLVSRFLLDLKYVVAAE